MRQIQRPKEQNGNTKGPTQYYMRHAKNPNITSETINDIIYRNT